LIYKKIALTEKKAKKIIKEMFSELFPSVANMDFTQFTDMQVLGSQIKMADEISYLLINGKADRLQMIYDQQDKLFAGLPSIGIMTDVPGVNFSIAHTYLGEKVVIQSDGFIERPEDSLSNDILWHKDCFYKAYCNDKLNECFTAYRSFLFSCIALVEIYINRFVLFVKHNNHDAILLDDFKILKSTGSMKERLTSWINLFGNGNHNIKGGKEWNDFGKIKERRNDLVHFKSIGLNYEIKEIIDVINASIDGVGGLLYIMHNAFCGKGYLGFIQQLKNQAKMEWEPLNP
jgi:hypothetical protein